MHSLLLTDALYEDAPGGSRRVVKELAAGLHARGDEVSILVPRRTGTEPAVQLLDGVMVYRYGDGRGGVGGLPGLAAAGHRMLRVLRRDQGRPFDIVHAHFAYSHLPALLPVAGLTRATVRTFYGPWADEALVEEGPYQAGNPRGAAGRAGRYAGRRALERLSLGRDARLIALSDYSTSQLESGYGVGRGRIVVIPGGVDHERFVPLTGPTDAVRRQLGLPLGVPLVLTVRRLAQRMGLDALIGSMVEVRARVSPAPHLVIVGQGPLRPALDARVAALGLSGTVHFAGFVPDADLPRYYQAADLFVLPTQALEGFGLITLEAFAAGLPVVGTPVGAIPELLAQVDRRLITHGTGADALAAGIVRFFHQMDERPAPQALRALVVRGYAWDGVVAKTRRTYEDLLGGDAADQS